MHRRCLLDGGLVNFPDVNSTRFALAGAALAVLACHGAKPADDPIPQQAFRPLAQLVAQHTILTPSFSIATGEALGWSATIPRSREYLRTLDDEIAKELAERGLKTQWLYPADLVRANKNNPTYAPDPYNLGANVLRDPSVSSGTRLGDPLVTQLRTLVALHEDARAVLMPVQLHFEKATGANAGQGVAVLKVALLDGRLGDVRWVGTVRSDPSPTLTPAVLKSLAAHFADLITAP
jgi:hypothetical protein